METNTRNRMRIGLKFLFAIIIVSTFSRCIYDYEQESIQGQVINQTTKLPISNVKVTDTKYGVSVLTDEKGQFEMPGLKVGHLIEVTKEGFKPFNLEITNDYKEGKEINTFKIKDVRAFDTTKNKWNDLNSHSYRYIRNDSVVIELDTLKLIN